MPYHVVEKGSRFCVEKKDTGKSMGCHPTKAEANSQLAALYASEPKASMMILAATTGKPRKEKQNGKNYTVVPVVALVEGVIHAMNAKQPEFVRASTYEPTPPLWNGRPVFLGHPLINGRPVSGNTPSVAGKSIGQVYQCEVRENKLCMEAWLDSRAPSELLDRVNSGEAVEVSVGVFVNTDTSEGEYGGRKYLGEWHDMVPDHLALLPAGDIGACSWAAGCGVRAASLRTGGDDEMTMYQEWLEVGPETDKLLKTLRNIPQSTRDKMPASDFAGPDQSFPIEIAGDVHDAASSLGRAKGNRDAIKAKIISIAYRKGAAFVAQLPEDWKKKKDQKNGLLNTVVTALSTLFRTNDTSDMEVRQDLYEALRAQGISGDVNDVYDGYFVYCLYAPDGMSYWRRDFTKDATGAVASIGTDAIEVEPKRTYEPVTASSKTEPKVASCSCQKEINVNKAEIVKFLETATEDQIKALSAVAQPPTAAEIKAAADKKVADEKAALKVAEDKAVADKAAADKVIADKAAADKAGTVVEPTFEQLLAKADPDTRAAIEAGKAAAATKKSGTIETLKASKRCDYTDEQLKAMGQAELDRLVKLAGVPATTTVDYSGQGGPRAAVDQTAVAAPPDLGALYVARAAAAKGHK